MTRMVRRKQGGDDVLLAAARKVAFSIRVPSRRPKRPGRPARPSPAQAEALPRVMPVPPLHVLPAPSPLLLLPAPEPGRPAEGEFLSSAPGPSLHGEGGEWAVPATPAPLPEDDAAAVAKALEGLSRLSPRPFGRGSALAALPDFRKARKGFAFRVERQSLPPKTDREDGLVGMVRRLSLLADSGREEDRRDARNLLHAVRRRLSEVAFALDARPVEHC